MRLTVNGLSPRAVSLKWRKGDFTGVQFL
jgi:hypothetical protein